MIDNNNENDTKMDELLYSSHSKVYEKGWSKVI